MLKHYYNIILYYSKMYYVMNDNNVARVKSKRIETSICSIINIILYYSNVNVLRNDNNVARVKSKRIETSICSIINIKLSTPIFGLPML